MGPVSGVGAPVDPTVSLGPLPDRLG
jgi:hypothetical protein